MTIPQLASIAAAALSMATAGFQLALALGLRLGSATLGGMAPTRNGVLTPPFRLLAFFSSIVLVAIAVLLLVRAGLVAEGPLNRDWVTRLTWGVVAFLVLNTIGNFAAPHPIERWVMGPTAFLMVVLVTIVAVLG